MSVVMATVLSVWITTNAYQEAPYDAPKLAHRPPVEIRGTNGGSVTVVKTGFHLYRRTTIVGGYDGCQIIREGQIVQRK
jgi:hypothetical protein